MRASAVTMMVGKLMVHGELKKNTVASLMQCLVCIEYHMRLAHVRLAHTRLAHMAVSVEILR